LKSGSSAEQPAPLGAFKTRGAGLTFWRSLVFWITHHLASAPAGAFSCRRRKAAAGAAKASVLPPVQGGRKFTDRAADGPPQAAVQAISVGSS
jgi:hypothetical protein